MEWILLTIIPLIISIITSIIFWMPIFAIGMIWVIAVFVIYVSFYIDNYKEWKTEKKGDHFWYEWTFTKEAYKATMKVYTPGDYCKMDFKSFEKYFRLNPSRYDIRFSCVHFYDNEEETGMYIVFNRMDMWKYHKFRRKWLQSRNLIKLIEFVQSDIDKMREDAEAYIEKAKKMYKLAFDNLQEAGKIDN